MKLRFKLGGIALAVTMFCTGCGMSGNTENIDIAMEQIGALEYDSALETFQLAEEAGEDERLLYRGQGIAYLGKTMYTEAAQAFEKALACSDGRLENMDYDINYYLATAYYKMGDKDKAIQVYDAIVALREKEEDAYYLRGVIYIEKGDLEKAQADFNKAMELDPENYDRLIEIYCVLEANGYKTTGQEYLQAAIDGGTKNMTNYEKGRICYYLEDYDNARTYLEKARDNSGYEAVLFLGKTYETLGDNNYAISVYNTYLENGNANPQVLNQLGLCKLKAADYDGALTAFQTAMNMEDNGMMQTLKMNEIITYERLGEFKQASVLLESYLKSYPDDEVAKREYTFLKTR